MTETISIPAPVTTSVDPFLIIDTVCAYYKMTRLRLMSKSRRREVVDARKIVCKLLKEHTVLTLKSIGEFFGQDHTTVLHAIQRLIFLMETRDYIREDYNNISLLAQHKIHSNGK